MEGSDGPSDRWPPIEYYRGSLASVVSFVIGAACIVSAIFLFTFCIPSVVDREAVCLFPHWLAASVLALVGILFSAVGVLYGVIAWLSLEPERYRRWQQRWRSDEPESKTLVRP
jgi:hypothetical protein